MKKNDLKKLLKPIIKECIKEAIFEEGVLSNIISEVVKGVGTPQPIVETKTQTKEPSNSFNKLKENRPNEIRQHLQESRQKLEESTGLKGVFEGVTPMRGAASPTSQHGALSGRDPADAGVDISGIVNVAGNAWKQLK
jgi:hypothetical protein